MGEDVNGAGPSEEILDGAFQGASVTTEAVDAAGAVMDTDFTAADEVMVGSGEGTHSQVTLAASQILGKKSTGTVTNLTATETRTILNVEDGSTADQSAAEIKSAYESNADTNAYDDAAVSKLGGIEAGATTDQTGAEIKAAYEAEDDTNAYDDAAVSKLAGIEASADVTDTTNVSAALVAGITGQIKFPATANPSADVNTLDDYEEGTYTVTATPVTSGSVTVDSSYNTLSYIKIGKLVLIHGYFAFSSISSPVGNIRCSLPFVSDALAQFAGVSGGVVNVSNLDFTANYLNLNVAQGVSYFDIREVLDNGAIDVIEGADLGGSESFVIMLMYRAAS